MKSHPRRKIVEEHGLGAAHAGIARSLTHWFGSNARDLPWRRHRTAWTALVAEAMLQQTQVSRVVDRFSQFMKRFPDPAALARASEQDILSLWQGMGYYRRAINLRRAAVMIVEHFGGQVPAHIEELRLLPGVGPYTAGAIASIVFDQSQPIVDGNVHRVLSRVFMHRGRPEDPRSRRWIWDQARQLVKAAKRPGMCNEGLMELGATVCLPRSPRCQECPLRDMCLARRLSKQDEIPVPKRRRAPREIHLHAIVATRRSRVLMQQRQGGLWAGMWQVPTVEAPNRLTAGQIIQSLNLALIEPKFRCSFKHQTTHRTVNFHVYDAALAGRAPAGVTWRTSKQLRELPMSAPQRRMLRLSEAD